MHPFRQIFQFKSFATRMSVYVLSFALVVFAVIIVLFYSYSREKVTDYAIKSTHGQLYNTAIEINNLLQTVETTMYQSVWTIEESLNDPDSLYRIIAAVAENNDLIESSGIAFEPYYYKTKEKYFMPYVSVINKKTEYSLLGSQSYDYPCMDWYLIPKLLKQDYWSEPYYDQGGGNFIMSTYSLPLLDKEGKVYAIFTANISLSRFTTMIDQLKPYSSSFTFLISRNGSYLTYPDHEKIMNETILTDAFTSNNTGLENVGQEMLAGQTHTAQIKLNGNPAYIFYSSIPHIGWSVANVCPPSIILKDLDTISGQILFGLLTGMLILFFVIHIIIRRLVKPLAAFSESARVIATGRFNVKLPEVKSYDEIKMLHDSLAYMQQSLFDYVIKLHETTATKERIESELSIARAIQMGMIPKTFPPFPSRQDVDLYAILQPAREVGGDLYDYFIENDKLYFIIGDVSGKGVPASLFMAIARSMFRSFSRHTDSPATIVSGMNNAISENNETNMFITLIVGVLDLHSGELKICNAGHTLPVQVSPEGKVSLIEARTHLIVGIMIDHEYTNEIFYLEKGTKIFFYTDGITEAENAKKELYGEANMIKTLSANSQQDIHAIVSSVICSVAHHVQLAEQSDDLTILVIHYEPNNQKQERN